MADYPARYDREAELAAALLLLAEEYAPQFERGYGFESFQAAAQRLLQSSLAAVFSDMAQQAVDERNLTAAAILLLKDAIGTASLAWAGIYSAELARKITDAIRGKVSQAIATGQPLADVVKATVSAAKIESIAITEITRAATAGAEYTNAAAASAAVAADGEGTGTEAIWVTAGDDAVCKICQPLDQQPRELWEKSQPLGPPAHPRCRCYLDYVEK